MAYARTTYSLVGSEEDLFSFQGLHGTVGLRVIYGNPFITQSRAPFSHFDFAASLGLDIGNFVDFRMISDGYLFSFSPIYSDIHRMSSGLSLHMDTISTGRFDNFELEHASATINMYSNALNWTVKYQRFLPNNFTFETMLHAGFTFFGASVFFSPERNEELKAYGAGFNSKLFFNLEHSRFGRLETSVFAYHFWSFPGTSDISRGRMYWLFADIAYFFPITERMSIGASGSFALERADFSNLPNPRKQHRAANLMLAWNF
jgi:hypothetical protein